MYYCLQANHVMAGFKTTEPYFLPEMDLDLPSSLRTLEAYLLPCIGNWRAQRTSKNGDRSEAADNFLNELLPYFVEVLVTSGIHFIVEFPSHPISELLRKIPRYEYWAASARKIIKHRHESREIERLDYMNIACRTSFETLNRRIDIVQQQQDRIERKVNRLLFAVETVLTNAVGGGGATAAA